MVKTISYLTSTLFLLSAVNGVSGSNMERNDRINRATATVNSHSSQEPTSFLQSTQSTPTGNDSTSSNTKKNDTSCTKWSEECQAELVAPKKFGATVGCNRYYAICKKTLNQVMFPGTSYSAIGGGAQLKDYYGTLLSQDMARIHQNQTVAEQLRSGIRYLDIPVGVSPTGDLVAASGFGKGVGLEDQKPWMMGQRIEDVLNTVEDFLDDYPNDVVVVDFSAFQPQKIIIKEVAGASVPDVQNAPVTKKGAYLVANSDPCLTKDAESTVKCKEVDMVAIYQNTQNYADTLLAELLISRYVLPEETVYSLNSTKSVSPSRTGTSRYAGRILPKREWTSATLTMGELINRNQRLALVSENYLTSDLEEIVLSGKVRFDPASKKAAPTSVFPVMCGSASGDRPIFAMDYSDYDTSDNDSRVKVAYNAARFNPDRSTSWNTTGLYRCQVAQTKKSKIVNFVATEHWEVMRPTVVELAPFFNAPGDKPALSLFLHYFLRTLLGMFLVSLVIGCSIVGLHYYAEYKARPPKEGSYKPVEPSRPTEGEDQLLVASAVDPEVIGKDQGFVKQATGVIENVVNELKNWSDLVSVVDRVKKQIMLVRPEFAGEDPLPSAWRRYVDPDSGSAYYYHHETGNSVWDEDVWVVYGEGEEQYRHNVVSGRSVWEVDWESDVVERMSKMNEAVAAYEQALKDGAVEVTQEELEAAEAEQTAEQQAGELQDVTENAEQAADPAYDYGSGY